MVNVKLTLTYIKFTMSSVIEKIVKRTMIVTYSININ
jgi:hypothetical protein